MAYKHGIYTSEVATSLVPMTSTSGGLVVAFGTAPVHLASDPADTNTPVLCYTYKEAVAALGYSDDWQKYTLAEVIKTQFALYNVAPIVLVNVLDTKKHKKDVQNKQMAIVDGVVATTDPVLLKTLEVKLSASHQKLAQDKDYTAAYDDDGRLIVTPIPGGGVPSGTTELCLSYTMLDPGAVKPADIIGGINTTTNRTEGLELIDEVFPRFGLVPGIIIAPGWSHDAGVAAVMKAKEHNICGHFNAISICDIPTDEVKAYTGASKWKNEKNFADKDCILCWPMVKLGAIRSAYEPHGQSARRYPVLLAIEQSSAGGRRVPCGWYGSVSELGASGVSERAGHRYGAELHRWLEEFRQSDDGISVQHGREGQLHQQSPHVQLGGEYACHDVLE